MRFTVTTDHSENAPTIRLKDTITQTEAEIFSFGGLLNAFNIQLNNKTFNCIDGFTSVEDAKQNITNGFKSAKITPFVCRLNNGEYDWDDIHYKTHKFYLDKHAIHGLVYDQPFEILTTYADEHHATVGLRYKYTGTDAGYPFAFELLINWKLEKENKLSVTTTVLHHNKHSIPLADGWHPYFTLGNDADDYHLKFDSNTQIEFDGSLIPTDKELNDERFINSTSLQNIVLDNCFVLNNPGHSTCILKNKQLQLTIHPEKSYPYLQIYTPPHRKSIAIENLSSIPDAFNNKKGLISLQPNQSKLFTTSYQITIL
jgi:aldose 1-epimerase